MEAALLGAPLSTALKEALARAGIGTSGIGSSGGGGGGGGFNGGGGGEGAVAALRRLRVAELARELRVSGDEAAAYKRELDAAFGGARGGSGGGGGGGGSMSALALMATRGDAPAIPTFCRELDVLLGGGMPAGEVTEVCGVAGAGKTQLALQLALDAAIPTALGGPGGSAVVIDTEGSVSPARAAQMADAVARHLTGLAARHAGSDGDAAAAAAAAAAATPAALLDAVHVFRATDLTQQTAAIIALTPFLEAHPDVRVVVVDSLAFHYRYMDGDLGARARHLQFIATQLHRLAVVFNVAVVVINQMTTKVDGGGGGGWVANGGMDGALPDGTLLACVPAHDAGAGGGARLVPALGDVWAHACTNRVLLGWGPAADGSQVRMAQLVKSPSRPQGLAPYAVTTAGIRSVGARDREPPPPLASHQVAPLLPAPAAAAAAAADDAAPPPPPPAPAAAAAAAAAAAGGDAALLAGRKRRAGSRGDDADGGDDDNDTAGAAAAAASSTPRPRTRARGRT